MPASSQQGDSADQCERPPSSVALSISLSDVRLDQLIAWTCRVWVEGAGVWRVSGEFGRGEEGEVEEW